MRYILKFTPPARKQLAALPRSVQERLDRRILALADNPRPSGCVKLVHAANRYRIRVGDYRVIYDVRDNVLLVLVVKVGHRRDVYRGKG